MKQMVNRLARLTPSEWLALFTAYLFLIRAGWFLFVRKRNPDLWIMNVSVTQGSNSLPMGAEIAGLVRRTRWINTAASHPLPWAKCLQRSVALCLWLERLGFCGELKIGVRKDGEILRAHAWVELNGLVLNDDLSHIRRFAAMNTNSSTMAQCDLQWGRR